MGADPSFYVVPYQDDIQAALDALREREFRAGRYHPAVDSIDALYVSPTEMRPGPGAQHESIEAVFVDAAERGDPDGTRSILDLWSVSDRPEPFAASGLTRSELERYFGTAEPSVDDVNDAEALWAAIERGTGRYVIAFEDGRPAHLCFAGFSLD